MDAPPPDGTTLPAGTFAGQVAVVTGGGTGLELELARGLAALGAEVAVLSRDPAHHAGIPAQADEHAGRVYAEPVDVREPELVRRAKDSPA